MKVVVATVVRIVVATAVVRVMVTPVVVTVVVDSLFHSQVTLWLPTIQTRERVAQTSFVTVYYATHCKL
jgi:hypothetical protein